MIARGIAKGPLDVPLAMLGTSNIVLRAPHVNKRGMGDVLGVAGKVGRVGGWCSVWPSLLIDVKDQGQEKVKQGKEVAPPVGYGIGCAGVARWIFEDVIARTPYTLNEEKPIITL